MKKALLWERKCTVTLDPLTIFSFLVVHSKLTWNKNYWKCISVTREKNHVIISVLSKSSELQIQLVHPTVVAVCMHWELAHCFGPYHFGLSHSRPWLCSMWHLMGAEKHLHSLKHECWLFFKSQLSCTLLAFPWCIFWTELTMLVSLCRYGLMQLLRYFTP